MADRNTTFILKRSNVPDKIPILSQLKLGEMALNTADVKAYAGFTGGLSGATEIRQIGWDRLSTQSGGTVNGNVQINGSFSANTIYVNGTNVENISHDGLTDIGLRTHPELDDAWRLVIGSIVEDPFINIVESGGTVSLGLERNGGGNLTLNFSGGTYTFNSTPAASVNLTVGTDTNPQNNYVYIPEVTKVLTISTTGFPSTQHIPIATVLLQSASSVAADGPYKVHQWSDHLSKPTKNGHISDINFWIRQQNATFVSGMDNSITITPNASAPDDLVFSASSGVALRLHEHSIPAFTGTPEIYVVNDPVTPYKKITNLNEILVDSDGGSLSDRTFSLVLWVAVNEEENDCKLFVNLPRGSYGTDNGVIRDANTLANKSIPQDFVGVGVLYSEFKLKHQSLSGGTWSLIQTLDLRKVKPVEGQVNGDRVSGDIRDNYTLVTSIVDFPESVGNVITLQENYIYEIVGSVNMGDTTIQMAGNTHLMGIDEHEDKLIYTGSSTFINCVNKGTDVEISSMGIEAPNGTAINFVDTGSTSSYILHNVRFTNIGKLGVVNGGDYFKIDDSFFDTFNTGFEFATSASTLNDVILTHNIIEQSRASGTGSTIAFSALSGYSGEVFQSIGNRFKSFNSGDVALSFGVAPELYISGSSYNIVASTFTDYTTPLSGFSVKDDEWLFAGNQGIPNTDERSNKKVIRQLSNFPDPIGGIIQLQSSFAYEIEGEINLGDNILKFGNDTKIFGLLRRDDKLIYSGTSYAIMGVDSNFTIDNLSIEAPNGTVIDFSASTGNENLYTAIVENCVFDNVGSIARIEGPKIVLFENNYFGNIKNGGFDLYGSNNGVFFLYDNTFPNVTGTTIQFGTSGWDAVGIARNSFYVTSGNTGISGLANNGNLKTIARGRVTNNAFNDGGVYLSGIITGGTRWQFLGNDGVSDDTDANANIELYITSNVTETPIATQNVPEQIQSSNYNVDYSSRFLQSGGTVTYDGVDPTRISLDATCYFTSTNNQNLIFYFALDTGSGFQILTSTKAPATTIGAGETTFANPKGLVDVSNGDRLAVFVENTTSSNSLTVTNMNWTINT